MDRPLRLITSNPVDQLARTLEALLVVASSPLSVDELAAAADDDTERIETALGLLGDRYREGRSGIVLERVAGGYAFRAAREAAPRATASSSGRRSAGSRRRRSRRSRSWPTSVPVPAGDRADPGRRRRLRRRRARGARADRRGGPGRRRGRRRALPHDGALRARLRPRERGRAAAARRPRRHRRGDPRAAPTRSPSARQPSLPGTAAEDRHRVPSRVIPSTSTSFEPIMKSTWTPLRSRARGPPRPRPGTCRRCRARCGWQRSVDQRVVEDRLQRPDPALLVDERDLAEPRRPVVLGDGRPQRVGADVGVRLHGTAALELDANALHVGAVELERHRRRDVAVDPLGSGVVKTSSVGRFG